MRGEKQSRELVVMKIKSKYWLSAFGTEYGHWEAPDLISEGHTRRCKDQRYETFLEPNLVHEGGVEPGALT